MRRIPTTFVLFLVSLSLSQLVVGQGFTDSEYPWTYQCIEDTLDGPACQRQEVEANSTQKVPFNTCILTCGPYGSLWPYPTQSYLGKSLTPFDRQYLSFSPPSVPDNDAELLRMINEASEIFQSYVNLKIPDGEMEQPVANYVEVRLAVVERVDKKFTLDTNESYTLTISKTDARSVVVSISGPTFFGVRHGLETLAQLIDWDSELKVLHIVDTVTIQDEPKFVYRGLLLDTGRNFYPVSDLKRLIDGLSYNKMNVFHWHLTDSNSFPFYSARVPQMVKYGTYGSKKIYYPQDVSEIVEYANQRGVKVIPELDIPSHAGNGWQWGEKEGLGLLSLCVNAQPYLDYCIQPPCGQLNPLNENTYRILGELYRDFLEVFDSDVFHIGGDEISFKCWMAYQEINDWLTTHNTTDLMELWGLFQESALERLKEANAGKPISAIVWTSEMTSHGRQYLPPQDYIIQIWSKATDDITTGLYEEGYRVIFSNNDTLYLDHGYGPWRGNYVNPNVLIKTWQQVYANDILGQVERQVGREKMEELYNTGKLMGGTATLWSEKTDPLNMDMKMWPRGAAYAERLWSYPPVALNVTQFAYPRLIHHRERMVQRGIKCDTLLPEACYNIWGFCDNAYW